jgi:hypothetical protein
MSKDFAASIFGNKDLDQELKKRGFSRKEICPFLSSSDYANSVFFVKCIKDYCMLWNGKACSFFKASMTRIGSDSPVGSQK